MKKAFAFPEPENPSSKLTWNLVAAGRQPDLEGLGFAALGIDDSSYLKVNGRMRLAIPGLYAVGNVNGISLLDSTAFSQASIAIESILGRQSRFDPFENSPLNSY